MDWTPRCSAEVPHHHRWPTSITCLGAALTLRAPQAHAGLGHRPYRYGVAHVSPLDRR